MKLEPANIVCPACGSGNYMRHLIGKNVGHLDMKCINCNSYFNFDELYKRRIGEILEPKPITNADRIRSMSDEELSSWYFSEFFKIVPYCTKEECYQEGPCEKCLLDWLKQESEPEMV